MGNFRYCEIGDALVDELCALIEGATSVFLLGPRFSGKRSVLREAAKALAARGIDSIVDLPILEIPRIETEQELTDRLVDLMRHHLPQPKQELPGLLGPIEALSNEAEKRIVLLISNLDHLPYHIALRLLQNIWSLEQTAKITCVITGGAQIRELVREAKPGAVMPSTYVIQGLSRARVASRIRHSIHVLGFEVDDEAALCAELWTNTRGNMYLERLIFNSLIDSRLNSVTDSKTLPNKEPVTLPELRHIMSVITPLRSKLHIDALQDLSRDAAALLHLELLLAQPFGGCIQVPLEDGSPTVLELTGLARRSPEVGSDEDVTLAFTSPLVETLARGCFDDICLGDLKAEHGDWDKVFQAYKRASPARRIRPYNDEDRNAVATIVRRLGDRMRAVAKDGVSKVDELFEHGCQYVLGYPNVTAIDWQLLPGQKWQTIDPPAPQYEKLVSALGTEIPKDGLFDLPGDFARTMQAYVVPDLNGCRRMVLIGDLKGSTAISRSRLHLLSELCHQYNAARKTALALEDHQQRLKVFQQELTIINRIFKSLREETMDVEGILHFAAEEMSKLGYPVISFGAPDIQETKINCIQYFDRYDRLRSGSQWPDNSLAESHFRVFSTGSYEHFQASHLNREMLIFPLFDGSEPSGVGDSGKVVATMQVEREGKGRFSDQEIEDLRFFGGYLISGTAQSTRSQLLQHALARIGEPTLISDHQSRLRYANQEAANLFGVESAWYDSSNAPPLPHDAAHVPSLDLLQAAISEGRETTAYREGIGSNPAYRGRVTAAPIHNSRKSRIGALLHVQDLNDMYSILEALETIVSATDEEDLFQRMLKLAEKRGHSWARVYSVVEGETILAGRFMRGADAESIRQFEIGTYRIPNSFMYQWSWKCFSQTRPIILKVVAELEKSEPVETKFKLPVSCVHEPPWQDLLLKTPGDMWMDVPLYVGGKAYAKLSLNCSEDIRPDTVEFWRTVAAIASRVLDLIENATEERMYISQNLIHRMDTSLAPLSGILIKYDRVAAEIAHDKLAAYNDELRRVYRDALEGNEQRKPFFRKHAIKSNTFDLAAILRASLKNRRVHHRSVTPETTLSFHGDETLLRQVIGELVNNSTRVYRQMVERTEMEPSRAGPYDPLPTINITAESISKADDPRLWVRIVVEDNGPGISMEVAAAVFNGLGDKRSRAGFGLTFISDVIRAHGGSTRILPKKTHGAVFELEIPNQTEEKGDFGGTHKI